jgi:hypothetical protein
MSLRWVVRTTLVVLLLGLPPIFGCGGSSDNGPTEEPNIGPASPPGAGVLDSASKPTRSASKK